MRKIKRLEVTFIDGTRLIVDGDGTINDVSTTSKGEGGRIWHYLSVVFTPRKVDNDAKD